MRTLLVSIDSHNEQQTHFKQPYFNSLSYQSERLIKYRFKTISPLIPNSIRHSKELA